MCELLLDWRNTREWEKGFMIGEGWETIGELPRKIDRGVVALLHTDTEDEMPWCVEYQGNGRYFKTKREAEDYVINRWGKRKGIFIGRKNI